MQQRKIPVSLHSCAFQLRKKLLKRAPLEVLLNFHKEHQDFLSRISPLVDPIHLSYSDRFAWKFLREVNILNLDYSNGTNQRRVDRLDKPQAGRGIYQDLDDVVVKVQKIWFPEMDSLPGVVWLKRFSTRKLAHYSYKMDEIAFSLIFDSMDAPAEIISYLAYHELLHRQLGSKTVNGRRYSHTGHFKDQEHLFPNWRAVDEQISQFIINTI